MFCLRNLLMDNDVLDCFHDKVLTKEGNVAITRTYNFVGIEGWHKHMVFPGVDYIGRFENFANDFLLYCRQFLTMMFLKQIYYHIVKIK